MINSAAPRVRWLCALAGAIATIALAPGAAMAHGALLGSPTGSCSGEVYTQPFMPWLDPASYVLVADGGFEAGAAGWTLGGAGVVDGNEPWSVRGSGDTRSLYIPAGAQVSSPATCIGLLHPTTRFFARSLGGTLKVDAGIRIGGLTTLVPVGVVVAGNTFAPTLPLPLLANVTNLLSDTGSVTLRFTAVGGPMEIDDVYVDPFKVN